MAPAKRGGGHFVAGHIDALGFCQKAVGADGPEY